MRIVESPPLDDLGIEAARSLAARCEPDAMAALVTVEVARRVWPEHTRDPDFLDALSLSVRDNIRAILGLFSGTLALVDANPEGAFGFADLTAELGIPVSQLESAYWVGVQSFWRLWFARAVEAAEPDGEIAELLGPPTDLLFDYIIHILGAVIGRYDAARSEILRNREDRRRAAVNQILDGEITAISQELENVLGYRLRATHVALALELDERAHAERVIAALALHSGAQGSLLLLHSPGTWAAWLGFAGRFDAKARAAVGEAAAASGIPITIGTPGTGLGGLRRTCVQALDAARLRRRFDGFPTVLWFADVRLELLMLGDEATARQFVLDELGELAADDDRAARTRETLLAWFTTGSQAAAAAQLGVHENTVRLRIRHAEEVHAKGLTERRAEILAALRLRQLFGAVRAED